MNRQRVEHYLGWARPFFETVGGRIGYIPGGIFHLWHGDLIHRKYDDRLAALRDFDPFMDIARRNGGGWRWSSSKRDLHARLMRYFEERNEDGSGAP
jgi:hypothetical protein